jgi:hypothetical protein
MRNFIFLLISLLLWAVSLFLVGEAAKSQKWAVGGAGAIPDPYSGVAMSQLLSCLFILLWLARAFFSMHPAPNPLHFIPQLLVNSEQLTPGILLGTYPPLVVGVVKLMTALVVSRGDTESPLERRNRRWVTSVFIALHLSIAIAAAILLIRFSLYY